MTHEKTAAETHTNPQTTTTQQPAATMPSEQRVDPLQVIVKNPPHNDLLNQDPAFDNPKAEDRDSNGDPKGDDLS